MKKDFFITYHEDDEYAARWISGILKEEGFSTLIESWQFIPGDSTEARLKYVVNTCVKIVVLLSDSFLQLEFTHKTVPAVLAKELYSASRHFIPVKVRPCNLTDGWNIIEVFDLTGIKEEEAKKRLYCATVGHPNKTRDTASSKAVGKPADDILKKKEQEYEEEFSKIIKNNYHMKLKLEQEVEKDVEAKNERTGRYERRKELVWEGVDLDEILSDKYDYILVNASGMGKTTFLAYVAYTLLRTRNQNTFIPIFISCNDINMRDKDISSFLTKRLNSDYNNSSTNVIPKDWENLCILMDGLDQAKNVDEILSSISPHSKNGHYKKAKIILSSRQNTAARVKEGFRRIRLKLPGNDEIRRYLGKESYMKLDSFIQSSEELITVPVLLGMLKTIAERGHISSKIVNRADLYTEFTRILIDHERRKPRFWENVSFIRHFVDFELEEALEKIAFFSLSNNEILEIDKKKLLDYCGSRETAEALLNIGILLELFEDMKQKVVFRHQSFQAYFAARYIFYRQPDLFEKLTGDIRFFYHDVWQEVIRFYVGLEKESEKAEGTIESISKTEGILKKIVSKNKLESAFRLIFSFFLMFEARVSKDFVLKISLKLRELLKNKREYMRFLLSNSYISNKSNKHYQISIDTIFEPLLRRDNYEFLRDIAAVLGKIGTSAHVPLLDSLLKNENGVVRSAAANALGEIGASGHAFQLENLIKDSDRWVRSTAFEALKKIGTSEHIALIESYLNTKNSQDRRSAFAVIGEVGTAKNIPIIKPMLNSKDSSIRADAAEALGEIFTKEDIPILKPLLVDKSEHIRNAAAAALGNIGTSGHMPLLTPLLEDESRDIRDTATKALGKILKKKDSNLLPPLLESENEYVRIAAIIILGDIGSEKDIPLLEPALRDKSWMVRCNTAEVLGKIGTVEDISLLLSLIKDNNGYVRRAVAATIGKIGNVESISLLEPLINDKDSSVRAAVAATIGKIGNAEHASLLEPLINDKDSSIRCAAITTLEKIGTPNHIFLLNPILGDRNWDVRRAIARAIGTLGTEKDIPFLFPFLVNEDYLIRCAAVEAMGKIGTASHSPALVPFLKDSDFSIRNAAADALKRFVKLSDIQLLAPFLRDSNAEVRKTVADVFREIGTINDYKLLKPLLKDKDWGVRETAADALGIICTTDHLDLLEPFFTNRNSIVRQIAAETLGKIGNIENIPLLKSHLGDKHIYRSVAEAIDKIYKRSKPEFNPGNNLTQKVQRDSILYYPRSSQLFHILHISDIHYALDHQAPIQRIFQEFLEDLSKWRQHNEKNEIHAVCITGDISKSGSPDQYDAIQKNINDILAASGCPDDKIFMIPGNHDIQDFRDISPKLQEILKGASERDHYVNREVLNTIENYQPFYNKFSNYYDFIRKCGYKNSLPEEEERGLLKPWYSKRLDDYPFRILGLNSAIFCLGSLNKYGQIRMGTDQFIKAYLHDNTPPPSNSEIALILTHHPLQWFSETEYYELKTLMDRYSVIHLYGHIHKIDVNCLFSLSGNTWLSIGTGSLYGDGGTEYINTYNILSFDFQKKEIQIRARRWNPEMGRWTVYDNETRNTFPFPKPC